MRRCMYCKNPLEEGDRFCVRCGRPVTYGEETKMMPGQEIPPQGSLDPTPMPVPAPDPEDSERTVVGGGLYYGDEEDAEGSGEPEENRRRFAVIAAVLAAAVAAGAFFLVLSARPSSKDGSGQEDNPVTWQDTNPAERDSSLYKPLEETEESPAEDEEDRGEFRMEEEAASPDQEEEKKDAGVNKDSSWDEKEAESGQDETGRDDDSGMGDPGNADDEDAADEDFHLDEIEYDETWEEDSDQEDPDDLTGVESADQLEKRDNPETGGLDGSYILSESSTRLYTREELSRLDDYALQMAINELYARHGRRFNTPEIQEYFEQKSWYRGTIDPEAFDGNEAAYFNEYELKNREMMAAIREERMEVTPAP